jgi:hypothetical protein
VFGIEVVLIEYQMFLYLVRLQIWPQRILVPFSSLPPCSPLDFACLLPCSTMFVEVVSLREAHDGLGANKGPRQSKQFLERGAIFCPSTSHALDAATGEVRGRTLSGGLVEHAFYC